MPLRVHLAVEEAWTVPFLWSSDRKFFRRGPGKLVLSGSVHVLMRGSDRLRGTEFSHADFQVWLSMAFSKISAHFSSRP